MTATEELRETQALIKAYESEISFRKLMISNPARHAAELEREQRKLRWQQEKVDRYLSYAGDQAEAMLADFYDRIAELREKLSFLRNKAAIEKLLKLQDQLNELKGAAHDAE